MSTSSDARPRAGLPRAALLRGAAATTGVRPARLDTELRFLVGPAHADPRLVDPMLDDVVRDAAERAAQEGRAQGFAEGYAAGEAAGRAAAAEQAQRAAEQSARREAEREAEVDRALQALAAAADALAAREAPVAAQLERDVVELAFALVQELLGRELSLADSPGADALARVLRLLPDDADVTVRLAPADAALVAAAAEHPRLTLVPDPSLAPGDAVGQAGLATVDARLAPALARVREALAC